MPHSCSSSWHLPRAQARLRIRSDFFIPSPSSRAVAPGSASFSAANRTAPAPSRRRPRSVDLRRRHHRRSHPVQHLGRATRTQRRRLERPPPSGHKPQTACQLRQGASTNKEFRGSSVIAARSVQTILLIPLTIASVQVFNLRGLFAHAQGAWNYILRHRYPSEPTSSGYLAPNRSRPKAQPSGSHLTWPRGLESLLKAKARGFGRLVVSPRSSAWCDGPTLPTCSTQRIWKIALVLIGWFIFQPQHGGKIRHP